VWYDILVKGIQKPLHQTDAGVFAWEKSQAFGVFKPKGGIPVPRSAKQERFCQEYIIDCNATQAYIRAGYSPNGAATSAFHLLRKPHIRERVRELTEEIKTEKIADAIEILEYLTACIRGIAEEEIVVTEGVSSGVSIAKKVIKKMDGRERVKAAELLAKRYGLLTEQPNANADKPVIVYGRAEDAANAQSAL
jgi:phage terminase small subunit